MTDRPFGIRSSARTALAFALAASVAMPATAQQADTPTTPPIDFRLPPPTDDGRSPGVQGPADNGIAPSGPADRRGPTPTPTPTPVPTAPRVIPTQPVTQPTSQPATRTPAQPAAPRSTTSSPAATVPAPDAADTAPAPSTGDATPGFSPSEPEVPATDATVPAAASDNALVPPTPADDGGTPIWMWLLALLAAGGAGTWYWRRRPALAVEAPVERSAPPPAPAAPPRPAPVPAAPAPAPRAAPVPAPLPRMPAALALPESTAANGAQRAPMPLVTRAAEDRPANERRALVGLALEVLAIRMTPEHVTVGFALNMVNQGAADATGLMVRIALNQGSAMTEPVLARFFDGAGGSVLRDDMVLKVGAGEGLTTEASLPRHILEPLMIGGKPMLVPVMAFDVTYHWEGDADAFGQIAGSFVLGRESGSGENDKLAPLPLDRASYTVDRPGSRSTAVRRSQ